MGLMEQIKMLQEKKHELEAEEHKHSMSPEEQREQLKASIKQDNEQIAAAEGQIKQLQEQIRRYEAQGGSSATMSAGGPPEPQLDTAAKMERLLQQEGELTDFIDNFDMNKGTALGELAAHKQATVVLLERISKGLAMEGNLPSQRKFKEMQEELEYKQVQMENAATTQGRLQQELELRKSELEKISTLEEKIKVELAQLQGKLGTMESELVTFSDLNMVKVKAADTKKKLEAAAVRYRRQKDTTRTCVSSLASKAEARKQQLHENELYGALEKLEIKMRSMEQSIFQMTEFIKTKEREADYQPMLNEITNLCETLNEECKKAAKL